MTVARLGTRPAAPVWRSILYVPGNVPKFIDRAHERGADCVLIDLEDSVQPAQKPELAAGSAMRFSTMSGCSEATGGCDLGAATAVRVATGWFCACAGACAGGWPGG